MSDVKIELSARKLEIRAAVRQWHEAGSILPKVFGAVLADYYGKDSQSPDNIQFFVNELHTLGHKRYVQAVLRLLPLYVFCDVKFSKADNAYTLSNTKGIAKTKKAQGKANVEAFQWNALPALLQHPALSVGKGKKEKAEKDAPSFRDAVMAEIAKGTTMEQMIAMLAEICAEVEAANTKAAA